MLVLYNAISQMYHLFPSISSGILVIFAIAGMIGKSAEIYKLIKELINYIKEHQAKIKLA